MKNKGFSLIELIMVIAIMAILVGVIAPQLIIYLNKAKVSADVQVCDSIKEALTIAMFDPEVVTANDGSADQIKKITDGGTGNQLEVVLNHQTNTAFAKNVVDILGYNCWDKSVYQSQLSTKDANQNGIIRCQMYEGEMWVWIQNSDMSGKNNCYQATRAQDVISKGVIYAN